MHCMRSSHGGMDSDVLLHTGLDLSQMRCLLCRGASCRSTALSVASSLACRAVFLSRSSSMQHFIQSSADGAETRGGLTYGGVMITPVVRWHFTIGRAS